MIYSITEVPLQLYTVLPALHIEASYLLVASIFTVVLVGMALEKESFRLEQLVNSVSFLATESPVSFSSNLLLWL